MSEPEWNHVALLWSVMMLAVCSIVCAVSSYREKRRAPGAWDRPSASTRIDRSAERQVPRQ